MNEPKELEIDFKGGEIKCDTLKYAELDKPLDEQDLSEDLLWVQYKEFSLDVGWYRDTFVVYIVERWDEDAWAHPWERSLVQDPKDLIKKIQSTIDYWIKYEK